MQAIFTSIRSPMGNGYRLVAASCGLAADERREIVRCAPSHDSLCRPGPQAFGLASFVLGSGRHCLFLSRSAGAEYSARGGSRVHTHVLVLEPAAFGAFAYDPLRVAAAARAALNEDWVRRPPSRLNNLELAVVAATTADRTAQPTCAPAADWRPVLAAVLEERRLLVVGTPAPADVIAAAYNATPIAVRARMSVSYGLKFAPVRMFQLIFTEARRGELERIQIDHDVRLLRWDSTPEQPESEFDTWLDYVAAQCQADRLDDLGRFTNELTHESSAALLENIATLGRDIETLPQADAAELDRLTCEHADVTPNSPGHARLLAEFQRRAAARREIPADDEQAEPMAEREPD